MPFGQAYVRLRFTEVWLSFKFGQFLCEGSMLYRKWRMIPKFVEMLESGDPVVRFRGAMELERVSLRYTRTRSYSIRSVEHGSIPGLLALLNSDVPSVVSAALCVLCDVYGHPKCVEELDGSVLNTIFSLTGSEDLFCRLRSALFLALLATEASVEEKLQHVVQKDAVHLKQITRLIKRPLPARFQQILDHPQQFNNPTHHLKAFKDQLRKAAVTILYQVLQSEQVLDAIDFKNLTHIVRSVRDKDPGLRSACRGCLKIIAKKEEGRQMIGESAARHWTYLMPKNRDIDCIGLIEELGVYPDLRNRFVKDGFFIHRLPALLTSRRKEIMILGFRSLFPFTLSPLHRWCIVKAGLLHLIIDGLYNKCKSVYIAAIICMAQLCVSQEVFLAIQAEFEERNTIPPRVGEYLIYLALCYPEDDLGQGGMRLLQEVVPRLKALPADAIKKLGKSLADKDVPRQSEGAKLIAQVAQVERFRRMLLQSSVVADILHQMKNGPAQCKAAMVEALSRLAEDPPTAKRVGRVKGLPEALWHAQEGVDEELAVAALELLRVLSRHIEVKFSELALSLPADP